MHPYHCNFAHLYISLGLKCLCTVAAHCLQGILKGREGKGREGKGREGKGRDRKQSDMKPDFLTVKWRREGPQQMFL